MIVEKKICDFLNARLDVPAYMERPASLTKDTFSYYGLDGAYVIIERAGGTERNEISTAMFAVKSIAPSLFNAAMLDSLVVKALKDFPAVDNISSCEVITHYNFTDTTTKEYRYQATVAVTYMED